MPFGSGSRSAQTPSESSQQSRSNRSGQAHEIPHVVALLDGATQYRVYHMWRKVGAVAQRGMPHHSQLFITDMNDRLLTSFGLFGDQNGDVTYAVEMEVDPTNPYNLSTSYRPNPAVATGNQILQAIRDTTLQCGPKYKLLHNNCQKFGRLVMTALGSSHNRELLHP